MILLAMDRAPSVRSFDVDGRLHVAASNISKANICPYYGREIPGWQELGLDGDRIYKLLRDPKELAAGAATFNNLPLLCEHVPVSAYDEESHLADFVVGSTGTDARMDGQFLTNSLVIWAKPSIDGVVNDQKRQLSSAYRYRPDMTPGFFGGVAYDGVMRDIVGNHVALVIEGRAGDDVIIGDAQPMSFKSKRALMLSGGLAALIRPHLAQDAKLDLTGALATVNDKSIRKTGASKALGEKVFGLVQPLLAADAALDVAAVILAVDAVADLPMGEDDDIPEAEPVAEDEDPDDKPAEDEDPDVAEDEDNEDKPAMDSATVTKMIADAKADALRESAAIRTAEREVRPVVGELVAMDSAADVYAAGLKALGVDTTGITRSSYGATFRAVHAAQSSKSPAVAQDSRTVKTAHDAFTARFPNRGKLLRG